MKYCLSDNGSQFLGQDFQDFLEAQEILPLHTTKEHAQTNANSERVHRWLKERLAILHATHPGKWYEYIALVVKAHNIAPRSGSSVCPREAFLGMKTTIDLDRLCELGYAEASIIKMHQPYTTAEQEEMRLVLQVDKDKENKRNLMNQKGSTNTENPFQAGDWVMVLKPKIGALDSKWTGPYMVLATPSPAYCVVRRKMWGKLRNTKLNITSLRPFHWRHPVQDINALYLQLPPGVVVSPSTIQDAGLGVHVFTSYEKGYILGNVRGETITRKQFQKRYTSTTPTSVIKVIIEGEETFLDQRDPVLSNWTKYINWCGPDDVANVEIRVVAGIPGVWSTRVINAGEELLSDKPMWFTQKEPLLSSGNSKELARISVEEEQEAESEDTTVTSTTGEKMEVKESKAKLGDNEGYSQALAEIQQDAYPINAYIIWKDFESCDKIGWSMGTVESVHADGEGHYRVWWHYHVNDVHKPLHSRSFKPAWFDEKSVNKPWAFTNSPASHRHEKSGRYLRVVYTVRQKDVLCGGFKLNRGRLPKQVMEEMEKYEEKFKKGTVSL